MPLKLTNNAVSRLSASLSAASTTLGVMPGDGAKFPALSAGDWCPLTIIKADGTLEIVKATARASDTFTVVRAREGTAATDFSAGDRVELRITSASVGELQQKTADAQATANDALPALSAAEALAMADTYTEVPSVFKAWMIAVTQPHLRLMVWSASQNKYIRAPWHAPGQLSYFLRNVPAGHIEVRSDVVLNTADFPDLAAYLGVAGATFVLDEARGEFLRTLDSGRGIDSGRAVGSWQDSDNKIHTHTGSAASGGEHTHSVSGTAASAGAHSHRLPPYSSTATYASSSGGGSSYPDKSTSSDGAHTHSVSGTAASAGAHTHTVTVNASGGTESRPRNLAYRLAVQY